MSFLCLPIFKIFVYLSFFHGGIAGNVDGFLHVIIIICQILSFHQHQDKSNSARNLDSAES